MENAAELALARWGEVTPLQVAGIRVERPRWVPDYLIMKFLNSAVEIRARTV